MPYAGVPAGLTVKMERCVKKVMGRSGFKPQKGRTKKQSAIAICKTQIVPKKKDLTLSEWEDVVRKAWYAEVGDADLNLWLSWIYEGYVIAKKGGTKYQIKYKMRKNKVTFDPEEKWTEVDIEFVPVGKAFRVYAAVPAKAKPPAATPPASKAKAFVMVPRPVKSVVTDDGTERYRAYGVLFGDADHRDLYKQYFTKDTNFHLDWYPEWPWLYHHGQHPAIRAEKVGAWSEFGIDNVGVFVEGELDKAHQYHSAIETLIGEEVLFPSSRAVADLVKYDEDGYITEWPITEVSTTVAPAEYRMTPVSDAAARAIKSLGGLDMADEHVDKKSGDDDEEPKTPASPEPTTPTEPVDDKGTADDGDEDETEAYTLEEVAETVAKSLAFDKVVAAITALDDTVKSLVERVDVVEEFATEMGKAETEKVKAMLQTGEWYDKLYVASKSADPVKDDERKDVKDAGGAQPLAEGESVWQRLHDPEQGDA